jgi:NTE family protein
VAAGRPRLGLALGSGSARGWSHIGVLRALAEQGIDADIIAGCSMGAIVGASYAAGRIEQLETWALALDRKRVVGLIDIGLRGGLLRGERLLDFFRDQVGGCLFTELKVPFAAVATDLASGQEVSLREGKVSDAVRASCAVPGLFRPVWRDGSFLVDGSIVNPIPVSLCRAMGAEVVIAVDPGSDRIRTFPRGRKIAPGSGFYRTWLAGALARWHSNASGTANGDPARVPLPSISDTFLSAIAIMQEGIAQRRLAMEPPDVLLTPRLGPLGPFEYHRAALAIEEGRAAVAEMLTDIRALALR